MWIKRCDYMFLRKRFLFLWKWMKSDTYVNNNSNSYSYSTLINCFNVKKVIKFQDLIFGIITFAHYYSLKPIWNANNKFFSIFCWNFCPFLQKVFFKSLLLEIWWIPTFLSRYSHRFSIGLMSGDCGGVLITFEHLWSNHVRTLCALCFESLF